MSSGLEDTGVLHRLWCWLVGHDYEKITRPRMVALVVEPVGQCRRCGEKITARETAMNPEHSHLVEQTDEELAKAMYREGHITLDDLEGAYDESGGEPA